MKNLTLSHQIIGAIGAKPLRACIYATASLLAALPGAFAGPGVIDPSYTPGAGAPVYAWEYGKLAVWVEDAYKRANS